MRKYSYKFITMALTEAEGAFFLDQNLHQECRELGDFLNPKNRIQALLNSLDSHNMGEVSKAIEDYKKAGVKDPSGPDLIKKAKQRLLHLKKISNLNEELRKSMKSENKKNCEKYYKDATGPLVISQKTFHCMVKPKNSSRIWKVGAFSTRVTDQIKIKFHKIDFDEVVKNLSLRLSAKSSNFVFCLKLFELNLLLLHRILIRQSTLLCKK